MGISLPELVGLITVLGALLTALVSAFRLRVDNRGAVVTHFKTLVDTYLTEVKRLNDELNEKEKDRIEEVKALKEELASCQAQHKQDMAQLQAQHLLEVAELKAKHTEEVAGLRRALQELKELLQKGG